MEVAYRYFVRLGILANEAFGRLFPATYGGAAGVESEVPSCEGC